MSSRVNCIKCVCPNLALTGVGCQCSKANFKNIASYLKFQKFVSLCCRLPKLRFSNLNLRFKLKLIGLLVNSCYYHIWLRVSAKGGPLAKKKAVLYDVSTFGCGRTFRAVLNYSCWMGIDRAIRPEQGRSRAHNYDVRRWCYYCNSWDCFQAGGERTRRDGAQALISSLASIEESQNELLPSVSNQEIGSFIFFFP